MALLAVVSGMSSFALTIIIPALPTMAERYSASYGELQLLVSGFLLGLAIAQPLWGHLADIHGRRVVVLSGFAVFIAASLASLLDPALPTLVLLRVLQAVGASAGTVVSRAIIRDSFSEQDAARAMSWVSIGLGTAPIIAPMIGGALLLWGDPRYVFAVIAGIGALLWLLLFLQLEETLPADAQRPSWSGLLGSFRRLLACRGFLAYTGSYGFFQGGFFAFLAVGAAVFQDSFGLGPAVFGTVWGFMGFAYVFGAAAGGRISSGQRRPLLLPVSVLSALAFALLMLLLDALLGARPFSVLVPMFCMMLFTGAATPLVMAGAVYQVPGLAGTAAGLSSALGMVLGGLFTVLAGALYAGDFTPVALLIATSAALTTASWAVIRHGGGRTI
jgi:DHA1 family bicyclomycin/chloramphenicol resistance-like MFS transporter